MTSPNSENTFILFLIQTHGTWSPICLCNQTLTLWLPVKEQPLVIALQLCDPTATMLPIDFHSALCPVLVFLLSLAMSPS